MRKQEMKRRRKSRRVVWESGPFTVEVIDDNAPRFGALVAIDNHWKSHSYYQAEHCHKWQHGSHIDSMPTQGPHEDHS